MEYMASAIRPEWSFELATKCQRLVGQTLETDREGFATAIKNFGESLPVPASSVERAFLHDRVFAVATRAGHHFHKRFHDMIAIGTCTRSPVDETLHLWRSSEDDPCVVLREWVDRYLRVFSESHEWPAAVRAAALLRRQFGCRLAVDEIAHAVGTARAGVTRAFGSRYGMSLRDFQTRVRVREAIAKLRDPRSTVEAVAADVGYKSAKNFYRALRSLVGLTPSGVRSLNPADCSRLFDGPLRLPDEAPRRVPSRPNECTPPRGH